MLRNPGGPCQFPGYSMSTLVCCANCCSRRSPCAIVIYAAEQIAQGSWASEAVGTSIQEMTAAVVAAVTSAAAISAGAASSA